MIYKPKHFGIKELVSDCVYKKRGERSWMLFEHSFLLTLDQLKLAEPNRNSDGSPGKAFLNDWAWGGAKHWQCFRTPDSPDYRQWSRHSIGKAADMRFENCSAQDMREYVKLHKFKFPDITEIELGVSWFHFACANSNYFEYTP